MILGSALRYGNTKTEPWWEEYHRKDMRHYAEVVFATARATEFAFSSRQNDVMRAQALYGYATGFDGAVRRRNKEPTRKNAFAQYTDTWVSKLGQNCPRPMWIPIGGDYDDHERAFLLTNWWDQLAQREFLRMKRIEALRDRALCGISLLMPRRPRPGEPLTIARVHPLHILMDDSIGVDCPDDVTVRWVTARYALAAAYPKHKEEILRRVAGVHESTWFMRGSTVDAVEVLEAYHIPHFAPKSDDDPTTGRRVVVCDGIVLEDSEWRVPRFPGSFARSIPPTNGFWGNNYYQRCVALQRSHARLLAMEEAALHRNAVPRIWKKQGTAIPKLTDNIGIVITYTGEKPDFETPSALAGDVYARIDQRPIDIAAEYGISELSATQRKPAGITSEPGFRAFADFEDARHAFTREDDARSIIQLAMAAVDMERAAWREDHSHKVPCANRGGGISVYPWPDLDMEDRQVSLTIPAGGNLPTNPAHRLEVLNEMRRDGLLDEQQFYTLLGSPDIDSARNLSTVPYRWTMERLDGICRGEKYRGPVSYGPLKLYIPLACKRLLQADLDNVPENRKALLRRWIIDSSALIRRIKDDPQKAAIEMGVDAATLEPLTPAALEAPPPVGAGLPNPDMPIPGAPMPMMAG